MKFYDIESPRNNYIKLIKELSQHKYREKYRLFTAEGIRINRDFINRGIVPKALFLRKNDFNNNQNTFEDVLNSAEGIINEVYLVEDNLYKSISDTVNSQGILGIYPYFEYSLDSLDNTDLCKYSSLLILDRIQDPGNVGTIIRSSAAAGIDAIFLNKGCVDIYNSKAIRATMGSLAAIPVISGLEDREIVDFCSQNNVKIMAASMKSAVSCFALPAKGSVGVVLGNEGSGISDFWQGQGMQGVYIPMENNIESLNVASAAAIISYCLKGRLSLN